MPISHLAAQVRDAGQGLVLLVVPLLAAVPVAAPGAPFAVCRGVAVLNLKQIIIGHVFSLSKSLIFVQVPSVGTRLSLINFIFCNI